MNNIDKKLEQAVKKMYSVDSLVEFCNCYGEDVFQYKPKKVETMYKIYMIIKYAYEAGYEDGHGDGYEYCFNNALQLLGEK